MQLTADTTECWSSNSTEGPTIAEEAISSDMDRQQFSIIIHLRGSGIPTSSTMSFHIGSKINITGSFSSEPHPFRVIRRRDGTAAARGVSRIAMTTIRQSENE
jgi:hypothetical protein